MFRKRLPLVASIVSATFILSLIPAQSATIAGTKCTKISTTKTIANIKYTCIKSGKKLLWNKGVAIKPATAPTPSKSADPAPTPTPTPSAAQDPRMTATKYEVSPDSSYLPVINCQIPNLMPNSNSLGFPRASDNLPSTGNVRGITLLVDFADLKHDENALRVWKTQQIPTAENFYSKTSYGKLNLKIDLNEKIYHINKSVLSYNLDTPHGSPMKSNANIGGLIQDSIQEANNDVDFSKYDFVNVVNPKTDLIGFEGASGIDITVDGKKLSRATFGPIREYMDDPLKYNWMIHEGGHLLGLMHPYDNTGATYQKGAYPSWDLMGDALTRNSEFLSWNKFLIGWLDSSNTRCLSNSKPTSTSQLIAPISEAGSSLKSVFIKLSDTKVLVIENRRASEFNEITRAQEGVIVYEVNGEISDSAGAVSFIYSRFSVNSRGRLLGTLAPGESVTYKNINVKVLSSAEAGDYVKIEIS